MESLLKSDDPREAVAAVSREWKKNLGGDTQTLEWKEAEALSTALLLGWIRSRWPAFKARYEILSVEKEVRVVLAPGIVLAARADATVRDRITGRVVVYNWKTTGEKKDFPLKWECEVQAWTEALAMQDDIGEIVDGCIFEGFYKGGVYNGESTSPLLRGYRGADGDLFWESGKGRTKFAAWSSIGLDTWIGSILPLEVISDQYLRSELVAKNDDVVRGWLRQLAIRETNIDRLLSSDATEGDRLDFFEQNWSSFNCTYCPYKPVCKMEMTVEDLLGLGLLREREDHHASLATDSALHS